MVLKEYFPNEFTLFGQEAIHRALKRIDLHSLDTGFFHIRAGGQLVIVPVARL